MFEVTLVLLCLEKVRPVEREERRNVLQYSCRRRMMCEVVLVALQCVKVKLIFFIVFLFHVALFGPCALVWP